MRETMLLAGTLALFGSTLAAQQGPSSGPKVRIAVMEAAWDDGVVQQAFMAGGNSPSVSVSERQTFARGLTEMMIAELLKSGRFIVVERKALDDVMSEQNLQATSANPETATQAGRLVAAQFLIRPEITEFSYGDQASTQGGAVRAPVNIPLVGRPRVGGGRAKIRASMVLDSRVIEVETAQILASVKGEATAEQNMNNFDLGTAVFDYNNTNFEKTPLGAATRQAVAQTVENLVAELGTKPWQGRVVTVNAGNIYVNAGQGSGINPGDLLEIFRPGEKLVDPETGVSLGVIENKLGRMRVVSLQEKVLVAQPLDGVTPQRGDIVRYVGRS